MKLVAHSIKKKSYFADKACKQSITTHVASFTKQIFSHKSKVIADSLWPMSNLKISLALFNLCDLCPNCFWFQFCSCVCSPRLPSPIRPHTCSLRAQGKANTTSVHTKDTAWDISPWYCVDTEREGVEEGSEVTERSGWISSTLWPTKRK